MVALNSQNQDNIARFYENVAHTVEDSDGIFKGDNLSKAEAQSIIRQLRALAEDRRQTAIELRSRESLRPLLKERDELLAQARERVTLNISQYELTGDVTADEKALHEEIAGLREFVNRPMPGLTK
jgi:acyl-CoA reductase-like NAD-dependent aldehyde dehydrogenase